MPLNIWAVLLSLGQPFTISSRWDGAFGEINGFGRASLFWEYELVDSWDTMLNRGMTSLGLSRPGYSLARLIVSRMDRPVVGSILAGDWNPACKGPDDELASGIAFWTLQMSLDFGPFRARRSADAELATQLKLASASAYWLRKAASDGDLRQRGYANLALAYSALLNPYDDRSRLIRRADGSYAEYYPPDVRVRVDTFRGRLLGVYWCYRASAPDIALRAASRLYESYLCADGEAGSSLGQRIKADFERFESWNCYWFSTGQNGPAPGSFMNRSSIATAR